VTARLSFAETAREVRATISVETVAAGLGLKLIRGRGPCPLCQTSDRSQAFSVRGEHWRCFACGAHGDVIDLTRAVRGCSAKEALASLSAEAGIDSSLPVSAELRCKLARMEDQRRRARARSARLTKLAAEAGRHDRLADLDAEAAEVAWRIGRPDSARDLIAAALAQREHAEELDREAERLSERRA
jgi:DNA primase